jgi:ketosteroid isomerase-like protein
MSGETMQSLTARYQQDIGNKDIAALTEHYLDDSQVLSPGSDALTGKQAIGAFLQTMFEMGIGWIDIEPYAHEQDGTLGVEIGRYTMRTARNGTVIDVGRYLSVRRQQPDGTWRIKTDISNSTKGAAMA